MENIVADFEQLMERVRAGCEEAKTELFDRFAHHVQRAVRRRMQDRLRRVYDSTDFTQSVWASFFQTPVDQYSFSTPGDLIRFLSKVAFHKVVKTSQKQLGTIRHGDAHATSLDAPHPEQGGAVGDGLAACIATPSQYVMADERWQNLVHGLSPGHRRVLEMLRDGHSPTDIIRNLGIHMKVIQRLREHLYRHRDAT